MEIECETETEIVLDGSYSVDVFVDGEHEWDIGADGPTTKIRIREQHNG